MRQKDMHQKYMLFKDMHQNRSESDYTYEINAPKKILYKYFHI